MRAHWTVFTTARSETAAARIALRLLRLAHIQADGLQVRVLEAGHSVRVCDALAQGQDMTWADWVLRCLGQAQCMAHAWQVTGDIRCELQAWSQQPRAGGVTAVQLQTLRTEPAD